LAEESGIEKKESRNDEKSEILVGDYFLKIWRRYWCRAKEKKIFDILYMFFWLSG
jgi:hypothetical protein